MTINKRNSPLFAVGQAKWDAFVSSYQGPYDLSGAVYAGMNHKVQFGCPVHGQQGMDAKNMMQGKQCQKCTFEARKGRLRMTQGKMLARFIQVHGAKYDYSRAVYTGQKNTVLVGCPTHGFFEQVAEYHWGGSGCPKCFHEFRRGAGQQDTLESFTNKVQGVFGGLFDLSLVKEYTNSQAPIQVRCTKHGLVCDTKPNWLLCGYNPCTKCNHMKSSGEAAVFKLVSTFAEATQRNRTLLAPKELDIYIPSKQLAIEYCGMYWHSHKDQEDERKNKRNHYNKYAACKSQGIRLLTIYESEWQEHNYAIRRLIRNAIGKSKGKLMARKCELRKVTVQEARAFYDKYHPQGGNGHGEHYALFWNDKMVACMRFVLGANDRGIAAANRVWTLGRYATRVTVAGAASRLFKAFLEEFKPAEVKSFSDNRFFDGGMYEQLGFVLEEEVLPDYQVWSPKSGLLPKTHYQRRNLPTRLKEHGVEDTFDPATDTRTEAEMTYLMGARRIYDCGKKRWVWTRPL